MEETQKDTENTAKAKPAQSSMPDGLDPQQIYINSRKEIDRLAAKQVSVAEPSKPTTMTGILTDPKGEIATKAHELGLAKEFEAFVSKQENIDKLLQQYVEVEEKRGAAAEWVTDVDPKLDKEAAAIRKSGTIGAIAGAVIVGAGAAFGANRANQSMKKQGIYGAIGALVGGITAGVIAIKRRFNKSVDAREKQLSDLSKIEATPELDKQLVELEAQLGQAQGVSFDELASAMAMCMTETAIKTKMNELASQAEQAEQAAREQAAKNKPEVPAEQSAAEATPTETKAPAPQTEPMHAQAGDHPEKVEVPQRVGGPDQGEVPPGSRAEAELARRARSQEAGVAAR